MKEEEEAEEEEDEELGHAETYAEYMPMKCKLYSEYSQLFSFLSPLLKLLTDER